MTQDPTTGQLIALIASLRGQIARQRSTIQRLKMQLAERKAGKGSK